MSSCLAKLFFMVTVIVGIIQAKRKYRCDTEVPNFLSESDTTQKIVGGQRVPSMIPWQVSLRFRTNVGEIHYCGGTILDEKTILTAAHCATKIGEYVLAGHIGLNGKSIFIEKVLKNPYKPYDEVTMNNDIMILKLSKALTMGDNVKPACLPSMTYEPPEGSICYTSGWGVRKFGGQHPPKVLHYVGIPMISTQACNESYYGYGAITENMICAQHEGGGIDACQGDSGGPLVCIHENKPIITGVVSFGIGCAEAEFPGVYAKVTSYLRWIKAQMEFQNEE